MTNHELAMLAFVKLARVSEEKNQPAGCDRFLSLAAKEACYAGVLDVAERCRELVGLNNPHHVLAKAGSCTDAVRDVENSAFFKSLERVCSFEHAEHLLANLNITIDETDTKAAAESELTQIHR
jgi:hypothetical protein